MSTPRSKGKRKSGGPHPMNGLGSMKLQKISPTQQKLTERPVVASDKNLLLGPSPEHRSRIKRSSSSSSSSHKTLTKYFPISDRKQSTTNEKFIKQDLQKVPPVIKFTSNPIPETKSKSSSIEPTTEILSDEEYNDLDLRSSKFLDLEQYDNQIEVRLLESIRFHPTKIVFGDNEKVLDTLGGRKLILSFKIDLSSFIIFNNDNTKAVNFNFKEEVDKVQFTDTKMMIFMNGDIMVDQMLKTRLILIYVGVTYMRSLKHLWKRLDSVRENSANFYNELTSRNFERQLLSMNYLNLTKYMGFDVKPTRTPLVKESPITNTPSPDEKKKPGSSLLKKEFPSLRKQRGRLPALGKPSRINTPVKKDTSSSPLPIKAPTTPSHFYMPASSAARVTRSATKSSAHDSPDPDPVQKEQETVVIDEPRVTPRRGSRWNKITFKPSVEYRFKDNSYYKIKNMDFQCLYRGNWINDTLIDFFLKYFSEEAVKKGKIEPDQLHVFTTFFFTKLKSSTNHYENIKRWVSKIDFTNKTYIIVPINENLHWYCSIIVGFNKLLDEKDQESVCVIYVFDSLKQDHKNILKPFRNFLVNYAKDKFDIELNPKRIILKPSAVPQQPNFNDCGIHVMYNVSLFLENTENCLRMWNTYSDAKNPTIGRFFQHKEREVMRQKLRNFLLQLQREQPARDDDSDVDEPEQIEDDEDDIVYIDADEFHDLRKNDGNDEKEESPEEDSAQSEENGEEKKVYRFAATEEGASDENKTKTEEIDKSYEDEEADKMDVDKSEPASDGMKDKESGDDQERFFSDSQEHNVTGSQTADTQDDSIQDSMQESQMDTQRDDSQRDDSQKLEDVEVVDDTHSESVAQETSDKTNPSSNDDDLQVEEKKEEEEEEEDAKSPLRAKSEYDSSSESAVGDHVMEVDATGESQEIDPSEAKADEDKDQDNDDEKSEEPEDAEQIEHDEPEIEETEVGDPEVEEHEIEERSETAKDENALPPSSAPMSQELIDDGVIYDENVLKDEDEESTSVEEGEPVTEEVNEDLEKRESPKKRSTSVSIHENEDEMNVIISMDSLRQTKSKTHNIDDPSDAVLLSGLETSGDGDNNNSIQNSLMIIPTEGKDYGLDMEQDKLRSLSIEDEKPIVPGSSHDEEMIDINSQLKENRKLSPFDDLKNGDATEPQSNVSYVDDYDDSSSVLSELSPDTTPQRPKRNLRTRPTPSEEDYKNQQRFEKRMAYAKRDPKTKVRTQEHIDLDDEDSPVEKATTRPAKRVYWSRKTASLSAKQKDNNDDDAVVEIKKAITNSGKNDDPRKERSRRKSSPETKQDVFEIPDEEPDAEVIETSRSTTKPKAGRPRGNKRTSTSRARK